MAVTTLSITTSDILALDDEQARELVARLCRAELARQGISPSAVTWGGDQRAADGGVDVRVDVVPLVTLSGYVKAAQCAFQVKAEPFPASKIAPEMAPHGKVRPALLDLAATGGAYIIVSTRDKAGDKALRNRLAAMHLCLSEHGLAGRVTLDFYDSRRILDWVEQHPPIISWVQHALGRPNMGWRPYGPWAYREIDLSGEYIVDERVKVFIPNVDDGVSTLTAIDSLRSELRLQNVSIRIVGLSGVGKTRLVQALFDDRVVTATSPLDDNNVLYTDLADNPSPQPGAMLEMLMLNSADSILVVDNCGPEEHGRLTSIVKRPECNVRLLTVEYDIRDDIPDGTTLYRLEGSSDEVIRRLVLRRFPILSNTDLDTIAEFSSGNARVAFALADTTTRSGELAQLRDDDLFKRLFYQKNAENEGLLRCAEVASLVYSFDEKSTIESSELAILAGIAEVSVLTFSRALGDLFGRGLLQRRGTWCAILPHAIANRLAGRSLSSVPSDILIDRLVANANVRLARSFARRLGYLHGNMQAREIVRGWLQPTGRYGSLEALDWNDFDMFVNIAPVDQDVSLLALERALDHSGLVAPHAIGRTRVIRIARLIAYDPLLFDRATAVLLAFASVEAASNNSDGARASLKSLFYVRSSGTNAGPAQRATLLRRLILDTEPVKHRIGLELLGAALACSYFPINFSHEFGARTRSSGWRPENAEQVREWFKPFIDMSVEVGEGETATARRTRTILAKAIPGLWIGAKLTSEILAAGRELSAIRPWSEGWLAVRSILRRKGASLDEASMKTLTILEKSLAPTSLLAEIQAKVLAPGYLPSFDSDDDDDGVGGSATDRAAEAAQAFGVEAAREPDVLASLLPELLETDVGYKVQPFGVGVGKNIQDIQGLVAKLRDLVSQSTPGSISLGFVCGLLVGWNERQPEEVDHFLDFALDDEVWGVWFPALQVNVGLAGPGHDRILRSITEFDLASTWLFRHLSYGRVTACLSPAQVLALISALHARQDGGPGTAIDLLAMIVHGADEKDGAYRVQLSAIILEFLGTFEWNVIANSNEQLDGQMCRVLEFALKTHTFEKEILSTLESLIRSVRSISAYRAPSIGEILTPFLQYFPKPSLTALYIADSGAEGDDVYSSAENMVKLTYTRDEETAVAAVQSDALLDWCLVSPDRYAFAVRTCALFEPTAVTGVAIPDHEIVSRTMLELLRCAPDKQDAAEVFAYRLHPSGGSGSLAAILKKRLPLFKTLNPHGDAALGSAVLSAEAAFRQAITVQEGREDRSERSMTESFE
jgi:hypothetical protein